MKTWRIEQEDLIQIRGQSRPPIDIYESEIDYIYSMCRLVRQTSQAGPDP